ncbi:FtsX-like permease family protein [Glaciibacter flavus]|uniref:FtsX-like permease family protein n=1 Tax=Orlajensenia flava TaxID=2565934 RepID=A0A4S4FW76_9MICO|nr:FtsX-like permease family protein [Glaciibacter flavus]THG34155.1 FtsX-like permease family protein [Glaciibacter flavus]
MTTIRLWWLLARSDRRSAAVLWLPVAAYAVVTTLLLLVIGGSRVFFSWNDDMAFGYQLLALIALTLLVVPLGTLGASAARLSARRRDERLSTLRLLGATAGAVAAVTVIESSALALLGAAVGALGAALLAPLIGLIPFRGEAIGAWALVPAPETALVVAGVVALAVTSAVVSLRRLVISPLGVRTRQNAPAQRWWIVVVGVIVLAGALVAMNLLGAAGSAGGPITFLVVIVGGFAATLGVLGLIAPAILRLMATRQARIATKPERLLAARMILESPKAAWSQVSGVAMTSFMSVVAGAGVALMGMAASSDLSASDAHLVADIRTGILITVIGSFLMVACSVGVNQAAGIADRRELYSSLHQLGMDTSTMDAARRRAVLSPLRVTTIGSALCAAVFIFPLVGLSVIVSPLTLVMVAGVLAAGFALVWLGLLATRAQLARAARA